jgi:uncharacterized protein (TIGR02145 family)
MRPPSKKVKKRTNNRIWIGFCVLILIILCFYLIFNNNEDFRRKNNGRSKPKNGVQAQEITDSIRAKIKGKTYKQDINETQVNDIKKEKRTNEILNKNVTSVKDIDGNIYKALKIGNQVWMAENLKTGHYSNGSVIPNIINDKEWTESVEGAWCYYANKKNNVEIPDKLYNWNTVIDARKLCPIGWHIPSNSEWELLASLLNNNLDNLDYKRYISNKYLEDKELLIKILFFKELEKNIGEDIGYMRTDNEGKFIRGSAYIPYWSSTQDSSKIVWHRNPITDDLVPVYSDYGSNRASFFILRPMQRSYGIDFGGLIFKRTGMLVRCVKD